MFVVASTFDECLEERGEEEEELGRVPARNNKLASAGHGGGEKNIHFFFSIHRASTAGASIQERD